MKKIMLALAALAGVATVTATAAEYNWKDLRDNVSTPLYHLYMVSNNFQNGVIFLHSPLFVKLNAPELISGGAFTFSIFNIKIFSFFF